MSLCKIAYIVTLRKIAYIVTLMLTMCKLTRAVSIFFNKDSCIHSIVQSYRKSKGLQRGY